MDEYSIIFDNVTFGYDEKRLILKNISFKIPKGKIVSLMGGSGSGKTTLLRLITGQYRPLSGTIKVLGKDITTLNGKQLDRLRKQMGVLFQFGALFTDMSVYENVAFPLKEHTLLPKNMINKIVAMKLNAVGLFGTQELFPHELSGGMSRRIALARSIVLDPQLMLYDEPFTGLDPIALNIAAVLIKRLNMTLGQTSILVTHDIESSMKIADYIYILADGGIVIADTPANIKNSTIPYVQQFIGGNIQNISYEYKTDMDYVAYFKA
jgi:phospholipid/cholesterol/gamma-HCH transport system ATP-binding protein